MKEYDNCNDSYLLSIYRVLCSVLMLDISNLYFPTPLGGVHYHFEYSKDDGTKALSD